MSMEYPSTSATGGVPTQKSPCESNLCSQSAPSTTCEATTSAVARLRNIANHLDSSAALVETAEPPSCGDFFSLFKRKRSWRHRPAHDIWFEIPSVLKTSPIGAGDFRYKVPGANIILGSSFPLSSTQINNFEPRRDWFAPGNFLSTDTDRANMVGNPRSSKWACPQEIRGDHRSNDEQHPKHESNSDVPSNEADYGGDLAIRRSGRNQEYQLADWSGTFAPAPVDWDDRPPFVDDRLKNRIQEWEMMNEFRVGPIEIGEHNAVASHDLARDMSQVQFHKDGDFEYVMRECKMGDCDNGQGHHFSKVLRGEIALRSWIPEEIDEVNLETWWAEHLRQPDTELDIEPFWRRFTSETSSVLTDIVGPKTVLEPADNDMSTVYRQTAEFSVLTFDNKQLRRAQKLKKDRAEQRALTKALNSYVPSPNQYSPRINLYLRPLESRDLAQVAEIYNYYIENTIFIPEPAPLRPSLVESRWSDITDARLPFLVAVDRSSPGVRRKGRDKKWIQEEHVLGFGLADDYNDANGMYRYTVEIETFVRPKFTRHGVGRCLVDKLFVILDPHYSGRGGYEFVGDEVAYGSGGKRVVGSVMVNIPYDSNDRSRLDWLEAWLAQFQFKIVGDFPEIGHKLNAVVNQAIMIKKTGSGVGAGAL